jgi:hypothetical protein
MVWYQISNVFVTGFDYGSPVALIKEDNVELARENQVSDMAAGSFFHDLENQLIYVWPVDSDNPNSNGKIYMFYVWIGFCDTRADYAIQGENSIFYIPAISLDNVPPFSQSIGELFTSQVVSSFGDIQLIAMEWLYENYDKYVWINSEASIKYGPLDGDYSNYVEVLYGLIRNVSLTESGFNLQFVDIRDRLYTEIPPDRYLKSTFPYISPTIQFNARAVLVGEKSGITASLVDTVNYVFEISQVAFNFHTFPGIEEISTVKKDGITLTIGADYTLDLANGQFTLTSNPGDSVITVDAKGLKIGRDFDTQSWNGNYSENISDITFFYLLIQGIEPAYIVESSFEDLQGRKTGQQCGDWLFQEIPFEEKLKELQTTGQFHLFPDSTGKLKAVPYSVSDAPSILIGNEYFKDFSISRNNEKILNKILLRYDREPVLSTTETDSTGEGLSIYKYYRLTDKSTAFVYQAVKAKNFKTIINNEGDAENAANDLMALFNRPIDRVSFQTFPDALSWNILEKIGVTYYVIINNERLLIYDNISFVITGRSIAWNGYIAISARKDPATYSGLYWTDETAQVITDEAGDGITT